MSLELTILGLLSWNPQSGYDLKKSFAAVDFIPWSGNNNQIYRTLIRLNSIGLVNSTIDQPKSGPAKKIYSLTDKGYTALKTELLVTPELEQVKNTFMVQLAFTEILENRLILELLQEYGNIISEKEIILAEELRRKTRFPERSKREKLIWQSIMTRRLKALKEERLWALELKTTLEEDFKE